MFYSYNETEGSLKEYFLTFFNFMYILKWNFSEVVILAPKVCSTSMYAYMHRESWAVSKKRFVQLVFLMVLNYMSIETFQKYTFWS